MEITKNQVVSRRVDAKTVSEDMTIELTSIIAEEKEVSSASGTVKLTAGEELLGNFSYDYKSIHVSAQSQTKNQMQITMAVFAAIEELKGKIGHYDE